MGRGFLAEPLPVFLTTKTVTSLELPVLRNLLKAQTWYQPLRGEVNVPPLKGVLVGVAQAPVAW